MTREYNLTKKMIEIGLKHTSELTVTDAVTAIEVGSGDMPVLATPMMMALMENAAMLAVKDRLPKAAPPLAVTLHPPTLNHRRLAMWLEQKQR